MLSRLLCLCIFLLAPAVTAMAQGGNTHGSVKPKKGLPACEEGYVKRTCECGPRVLCSPGNYCAVRVGICNALR